jgi:sugar phosphate permease
VSAIAAIVACMLDDERPRQIAHRPAPIPAMAVLGAWGHQMRAALRDVTRNRRLAWLIGYSAVVFMLIRATMYVYQPYLDDRGLGLMEIGLVYAGINAIGAIVAYRTHVLRRRIGDEQLLWALLGALAISFIGLAGAAQGPWMLSLLAVQAIAQGISSPLTKPLLNREIPDSSRRAAVLSVESMARRVAMGVFVPLVGLYGKADVMMLCGVGGIAGFVVLAIVRVRRGTVTAPAGSAAQHASAPVERG